MSKLELTRSREDRRLYTLDGVGTLRLEGFWSRRATAEAGGRTWAIGRTGLFGTSVVAEGAGEFKARAIRRGGQLQWGEQSYELRPASAWRERYALAQGDNEVALFEGTWGRRPVKIELMSDDLEPGLILFATFVVRGLAEDSGSAAGGAVASTAATAG